MLFRAWNDRKDKRNKCFGPLPPVDLRLLHFCLAVSQHSSNQADFSIFSLSNAHEVISPISLLHLVYGNTAIAWFVSTGRFQGTASTVSDGERERTSTMYSRSYL